MKTFTTGPRPAPTILPQPKFKVNIQPSAATSLDNDVNVMAAVGYPTGGIQVLATNLNGKIIWYYDPANYAATLGNHRLRLSSARWAGHGAGGALRVQRPEPADS